MLRFFLVSKHYRTPIEFSRAALKEAGHALDRIESTLARVMEKIGALEDLPQDPVCLGRFYEALGDDFNTPQAIGIMFQLLAEINNNLDKDVRSEDLVEKVGTVQKGLEILGFKLDLSRFMKITDSSSCDEKELKILLSRESWTDEDVQMLIKMREGARKNRRWDIADIIRDSLLKKGFEIRDEKDGVKVVKNSSQ